MVRFVFCLVLIPLSLPAQTFIAGILGGWQQAEAPERPVRKLALRIRERHLPGVEVETFENHRLETALRRIRSWHAANPVANIIIYGQSFGGAATVRLDRQLASLSIPVALSVQIDSVGFDDRLIPSNVGAAVNLFEHGGFPIRGQPLILAMDPAATKILGNFQYRYKGKHIDEPGENLARRIFFGDHLKMEDDPAVWDEVEKYILQYVKPGS